MAAASRKHERSRRVRPVLVSRRPAGQQPNNTHQETGRRVAVAAGGGATPPRVAISAGAQGNAPVERARLAGRARQPVGSAAPRAPRAGRVGDACPVPSHACRRPGSAAFGTAPSGAHTVAAPGADAPRRKRRTRLSATDGSPARRAQGVTPRGMVGPPPPVNGGHEAPRRPPQDSLGGGGGSARRWRR